MSLHNESEAPPRVIRILLWMAYISGMALFWLGVLLLVGFLGHLAWSLVTVGWRWGS